MKLAGLFALFGLPDQAAGVLLLHGDRLGRVYPFADGLELLAAEIQKLWKTSLSYSQWIQGFEAEDPLFFNLYDRREKWLERMVAGAETRPDLERRVSEAHAEVANARSEVSALRSSTSWKITAPLRALACRFRR